MARGNGLTVTVAVMEAPGQPLAVGVMVKVTVTGAPVLFTRLPVILPLPLAGMLPPINPTLSLTQLNVVPLTFPPNTIA